MDDAHAASAATACCLDNDRIVERAGELDDLLWIIWQRTLGPWHTRYASLGHGRFGTHLVTHQANGFGAWTDKDEAALLDFLGEVGIFRKKTVARVNGLRIGHLGRTDDRWDIQITLRGRR